MRILDVLMAFPSWLLAITIVSVLGRGIENALLSIAIVSIPVYARVVRAVCCWSKRLPMCWQASSGGASTLHVLFTPRAAQCHPSR
jgi:ABC-type dipeptide/oligopeptide/nickel transport system permease subunit